MPDDTRTDEALITDYLSAVVQAGQSGAAREGEPRPLGRDINALNILFKRYWTQILAFLFKNSYFKDESYLDDVRQEIFLTAFEEISQGGFQPAGPGTFRHWLYEIALHQCRKSGTDRQSSPKPISQLYPDESTGIAEDTLVARPPEQTDYSSIEKKLADVLSHLSLSEQQLMRFVSEGMSYQEIHQKPEFAKYDIDYLMRKVYLIRKKLLKLK